MVLLPAGAAASFAGAAVLASEGVGRAEAGLTGGVLNTAMECGPTVLFAVLLTLGGDAASLAATGAALAAAAVLIHRTRCIRKQTDPQQTDPQQTHPRIRS